MQSVPCLQMGQAWGDRRNRLAKPGTDEAGHAGDISLGIPLSTSCYGSYADRAIRVRIIPVKPGVVLTHLESTDN